MKNSKNLMKVIGAVIIASFIAIGCGGKKEKDTSVTVKPKTTTIKGDLGDYFEVVNKDYLLKKDELDKSIISVEVKRNNTDFPFPAESINPFGTDGSESYLAGFGIELFDASEPVEIKNATDTGKAGPYDVKDVAALLKLKKGETGFIRWSIDKPDSLKTFQLTSAIEKPLNSASGSTKGNDGKPVPSSACNTFLVGYEKFVNSYIAFSIKYKKNPTDPILIVDAAKMTSEQAVWASKKADYSGCNDPDFVARLAVIQIKLVEASVNMGK